MKRKMYLETETAFIRFFFKFNIINPLTVTFDQINVSFLNKGISFFKKKKKKHLKGSQCIIVYKIAAVKGMIKITRSH